MTNERLYRVLDSASARLATEGADAYRLSMEIAGEIIHTPDLETEDHVGAAYALWMEVSDLVDAPGGPESPELCRKVAERAAAAWDAVDQTKPERVAEYFARWNPRGGEDWRSAENPA